MEWLSWPSPQLAPLCADRQALVAESRRRRGERLALVRQGCVDRGIVVGQPVFKPLRRTDAVPYIDEVRPGLFSVYAGAASSA